MRPSQVFEFTVRLKAGAQITEGDLLDAKGYLEEEPRLMEEAAVRAGLDVGLLGLMIDVALESFPTDGTKNAHTDHQDQGAEGQSVSAN